jgi:hypothetical protein
MSSVISQPAVWTSEKTVALPKPKRHPHKPSSVAPGFEAPIPAPELAFKPIALAGAIARTSTTSDDAPIDLLEILKRNALSELQYLVQDGTDFELTSHFAHLVDAKRTHFAGEVGAGITHLYMESLRYAWRKNASCLTSSLEPHGDFLYEGGSVGGHGVVLAEAHGSFSAQVTQAKIQKKCEDKYLRQVKPWVGQTSSGFKVVHGYSVAFGCKPGRAGAYLALSETRINKPRKKPIEPPAPPIGTVSTAFALSTHRSNFLLMGARQVVEWIDWLSGVGARPDDNPVEFLRLRYAGRHYLASNMPSLLEHEYYRWLEDLHDNPFFWRHAVRASSMGARLAKPFFNWFVIEETAGLQFLAHLSAMITGERRPERLDLPVFEPVGFGGSSDFLARETASADYDYALFGDGLALLGSPNERSIVGFRRWLPRQGWQDAVTLLS